MVRYNRVQDREFLFILHNCGNTGHVTQSMISTDAGGLHFGNRLNLIDALNEIPESVLVFGNLDPMGVFKSGMPDHIFNKTSKLLKQTADHGNFIISSGCDTSPNSSVENAEAFFRVVKKFNSRD